MKAAFLSLLAAAFVLGSCTPRGSDALKTIHLHLRDDVKSLDPAVAYDAVSNTVVPLAMESLFEYHYLKRPLELQPLLAESMPAVSRDGKTYTIRIRKGVLWQDDPAFPEGKGRELVAPDFIYAWKRLLLPELQSPGTWIFDGKVVGWDEYRKRLIENRRKRAEILLEDVEGLKALDSHTIQIRLNKPYPQLLHALAMGFGAPVAREITERYGQDGLGRRMVGTGPYRLVEYTPGSRLVLERNPAFREVLYPAEGDEEASAAGLLAAAGRPLPFADRVSFQILREDQPAWLQFLRGDLDAAGIPKDSFDGAIQNGELRPGLAQKGIGLRKSEEAWTWFLNFNMKDKLVGGANSELRRAISMAVNREELIRIFQNGRGVKATGIVPRVISGHSKRGELANDYDPGKARELLKKAGYPDGKGLPPLRFDLRGSSTASRQQAEFIQKSLAAIGIRMEIIVNTLPVFLAKQQNGNLQFFLDGWIADFPDAENFLFLLYSKNASPGPNGANYANPAFDRLYERMAAMPPSEERSRIIRQAEEIVFRDGVWGMLYYPVLYSLHHGWLKNFRPDSQVAGTIKYYDLDLEEKRRLKRRL